MIKWNLKKLTKVELLHLIESNAITQEAFQRTIDEHANMRWINPKIEPCFDCRIIARKLGMKANIWKQLNNWFSVLRKAVE